MMAITNQNQSILLKGTAMLVDAVDVRALPVAASCGGVVYSLGASAGLTLASSLGPRHGWRSPYVP